MSWARYDDEFPMNRKVASLVAQGVNGLAAIGMHVLANTWARHEGTGGDVPTHQPGVLAADHRLGRKLAEMLEQAGMFDPAVDGWQIHDFDEYSDPNDDGRPTSQKKRAISEARREAGRRGGQQTASKRSSKRSSKPASKPTGLLEANGEPGSSPEPVPVPVGDISSSSSIRGLPPSAAAAVDLLVEHRVRTEPGVRDPERYATSLRRKLTLEHGDALTASLAADPDATPAHLAVAVLQLTRDQALTAGVHLRAVGAAS